MEQPQPQKPAPMGLRARLFLLVSQTVNTLIFQGDPDESLSARRHREGKPHTIDRWLGQGHCQRVYEVQKQRQTARHCPSGD